MSPPTAVVRSVVVTSGTRVALSCVVGLLVLCGAAYVPEDALVALVRPLRSARFVVLPSSFGPMWKKHVTLEKKKAFCNLPPANVQKRAPCPSLRQRPETVVRRSR